MTIADVAAGQYHADIVADRPTLSASIAHLLCSSSPKHAWTAHPRLNPDFERQHEDHFDLGTAAHAWLLEGKDGIVVVEADDWRTKDAKEQRDTARALSRVPLLRKQHDQVRDMVEAAQKQLRELDVDPPLFVDGKPEQTLVWEEAGGVGCRARLDWLRDDRAAIDDYKTARSANPEKFTRTLFDHGYDVQAAFYLRGLEALTGVEVQWRWVVQETQPPYALAVVAPGPDVLELAKRKVRYAIDLWRRCLERDEWPAYPTRVCWAELPAWEDARWLMKEEREAP
jgi:hypothetical protein